MPQGRPTKLTEEMYGKVEVLAKVGCTVRDISETLDVTLSTIYKWQAENPRFSDLLKLAKETANETVARALYKRAIGGQRIVKQKAMVVDGAVEVIDCEEELPPDNTACIFFLKNRDPDKWKDRRELKADVSLTDLLDGSWGE